MFENIHGLSCIENQVLAILRERGEPVEYTYNNSAVPLSELYARLVTEGIKQEYFNAIPRVQDALKELGVISLELNKDENKTRLKSALQSCQENEYILMMTNPNYEASGTSITRFRRDHYVRMQIQQKKYILINDIPEAQYAVAPGQLLKMYGGNFFKMTVKKPIDGDVIQILWDNRSCTPAESAFSEVFTEDFDFTEETVRRLRDMAGVCKILRRRMADYYGKYTDTGFIQGLIPEYERFHSTLEYYRLKPKTAADKIRTLMLDLFDLDNGIMAELKGRWD